MKNFFAGRWVSMLILAIGLFGFAGLAYQTSARGEAEKAQARALGTPEAVAIDTFQAWSDLHPADEVHVVARFFPSMNYNLRLTHKKKLSSWIEERGAMFLFGPQDSAGTKTVRGVLMIDKADGARWWDEELMPGMLSGDETQVTARLNGFATTAPRLQSMVDDALREMGLTKAPEFFYMESWGPGGRDWALRADTSSGQKISGGMAGLGLIFLLVAMRRFARRHQLLAKREQLAREVETARAAMIAKYRALGLQVPEALTVPIKPGRSKSKTVLGVLLALVVGVIVLAKLGYLDDALFAIPILILFVAIIGMRQIGKVFSGGLSYLGDKVAQKVIPERAASAPAPVYGPKTLLPAGTLGDSPLRVSDNNLPRGAAITSVPSLGKRLASGLSAPGLIKWAPFMIGVIVMVVSAKVFDRLGLTGQMGLARPVASLPAQAPATAVPEAAFSLPALSDMSLGGGGYHPLVDCRADGAAWLWPQPDGVAICRASQYRLSQRPLGAVGPDGCDRVRTRIEETLLA
ncbi:MAG: hypothetical protein ACK4MS_12665 [Paracoccaceae bacterium]